MENCEAMTSSTHSFAYSYRLVKKCFWKICETSKCHNFLIFQPIFVRFSLFCSKCFTLSSEIKLNLFWISSLNIPKTTDALYFYSTRKLKQSSCINLKKYDSNFLCDHMTLYRPLRLPDPSPQPLISRVPQVQSHLGFQTGTYPNKRFGQKCECKFSRVIHIIMKLLTATVFVVSTYHN